MSITEVSIIHHACIVLFFLWLLFELKLGHPIAYFVSLMYLVLVHERYVMRLKKKLQFEERKRSYQRRVLTDSETVRWLNHAVEKMWPVCMEQIASQKILLPIIPWFLEKYKPWTAKDAVVQHLYLGRNPPIFTEMKVHQGSEDDHLVLELGMNFLTAEDMSAILAVRLRKRLGFGMWTRLHITGMHIEGKVLIGAKFIQGWPFIGRLRVCFEEPPYFQMTVKPIFNHGIDLTEIPGIAGWLDKLLSTAFEQTLVQPNMLVVDVEKFVAPEQEPWFSIDVKDPLAFVIVEVIEAACVTKADLNGLADPYVKGKLGAYVFETKIQRKTLSPKWLEEFRIPIISWEIPNILDFEVWDKDGLFDDALGKCSVNISDIRDGRRYDTWVELEDVKRGRLHLAITVLEKKGKGDQSEEGNAESSVEELLSIGEKPSSSADEQQPIGNSSLSSSSKKSPGQADKFEPIDVKGQKETGIWIQQPGSEVPLAWIPRKVKVKQGDIKIIREHNETLGMDPAETHGKQQEKHPESPARNFFGKFISVFQQSPKKHDQVNADDAVLPSPQINVRGISLVVGKDGNLSREEDVEDKADSSADNNPLGSECHSMDNTIEIASQSITSEKSKNTIFQTDSSGLTVEQGNIVVKEGSGSDISSQRVPVAGVMEGGGG
ncbi:hypothetical protein SAY87_022204 [Trapa incisa]|uniref:C2 domain-containing protein n=1 Tax=Trapa incisa TaxID=236973 RepID=A0AAN7PT52_9MYRT|nr:hypothetical protein SAY87_022204 [Trapa incisa]